MTATKRQTRFAIRITTPRGGTEFVAGWRKHEKVPPMHGTTREKGEAVKYDTEVAAKRARTRAQRQYNRVAELVGVAPAKKFEVVKLPD